jgi:UDP-N-acetylglucosamine enolpyruvyl transferase
MWRFGDRDKSVEVSDDVAMTRRLAMLLVATAVVSAPPVVASADPSLDASFLDALTRAGITVKSDTGAVKAAKAACGMMAQGREQLDVVELVTKQNPGLDTTRAAQFTAIAASAYCPQYLQHAAPSPAVPKVG